ncbi:cytochrome P450 [Obba rivulosa]|uniref:Cytochrome P450 n=1 Tax=Obba rivulosa TaxID=1052685 RepID=A0A8E2AY57_9APHY|nr:cytochrome P450 [Obba rivulosa]
MPAKFQWLTYQDWSKRYGDLLHISAFGHSIVIISSAKIAEELFEKRSSIYSNRPSFEMLHLGGVGIDERLVNISTLPPFATIGYCRPITPADFFQTCTSTLNTGWNMFASTIIVRTVYGIEDQKLVDLNERAMRNLEAVTIPGSFLVDMIPALKHVPSWVPGATFQKKAAAWKAEAAAVRDVPFQAAQDKNDNSQPRAIVTEMLEYISGLDPSLQSEEIEIAKGSTAVAYAAGVDSTISTTCCFILAMVLYPAVQGKAYAELMNVVGRERLPEFSDRESLPYISAILKEYPKRSRAILHNAEVYPHPEDFSPDRFLVNGQLDAAILDPITAVFGFGRRICPGKDFADDLLFIMIVSILHAYSIGPALDENNEPLLPEVKMTPGFLS